MRSGFGFIKKNRLDGFKYTSRLFVHHKTASTSKPGPTSTKHNAIVGKIEHHPVTVLKTFMKYLWPKETGPRVRVVVALSLLIGSKVGLPHLLVTCRSSMCKCRMCSRTLWTCCLSKATCSSSRPFPWSSAVCSIAVLLISETACSVLELRFSRSCEMHCSLACHRPQLFPFQVRLFSHSSLFPFSSH